MTETALHTKYRFQFCLDYFETQTRKLVSEINAVDKQIRQCISAINLKNSQLQNLTQSRKNCFSTGQSAQNENAGRYFSINKAFDEQRCQLEKTIQELKRVYSELQKVRFRVQKHIEITQFEINRCHAHKELIEKADQQKRRYRIEGEEEAVNECFRNKAGIK